MMKRLSTFLLISCMIIASAFALSSCGDQFSKNLKDDPDAVLSDAIDATIDNFFELGIDSDKLDEAIEKNGGTMTFNVGSSGLDSFIAAESESILNNVFVLDRSNSSFANKLSVDVSPYTFSIDAFGKDDTFIASFPDASAAFELNFSDDFVSRFKGSELYTTLTSIAPVETLDQIAAVIDGLFSTLYPAETAAPDAEEDSIKLIPAPAVTDSTYDSNGKSVKCSEIKYVLDNAHFKAIIYTFIEDNADAVLANTEYATIDALKADIDSFFSKNAFSIVLTAKINKSTQMLVSYDIGASFAFEGEEPVVFDLTATISDTKIVLTLDSDFVNALINITKEENSADNTVLFKFDAEISDPAADAEKNKLNASFKYNKTDKTYEASIVVAADLSAITGSDSDAEEISEGGVADEPENLELTLSGKIEASDTKSSFTLTAVTVKQGDMSFTLAVDVSLLTETAINMPALPTEHKDLFEMNSEEFETVFNNIMAYYMSLIYPETAK